MSLIGLDCDFAGVAVAQIVDPTQFHGVPGFSALEPKRKIRVL
jgi:hypothetical protein